MEIKLKDDDFKYEKEEIEFYSLSDYTTQPNHFYTNKFRDDEKIENWHKKAFTRMQEIAASKKTTIKRIEELQKNKNNMPITEYIDEFLNIFYLGYPYRDYGKNLKTGALKGIDNNDILKKELLKQIDDKTLKKLKTNIVEAPSYWGDDPDYEDPNKNLTFFVLSKEKLNLHKTYSQEEILELYHSKKIFVLGINKKETKQEANDTDFLQKIYARRDGSYYTTFPDWYMQPIAAEIIRDNPEINKQVEAVLAEFKAESKELAHLMFKSMYSIFERQKEYIDENYKKEKEANKKRYQQNLGDAKREFDRKEEKTEKEKKDFYDSKKEMEETIEELLI